MRLLIVLFLICSYSASASAQDYTAMQAEGFGNVAKLLQQMTPEQRAAILKQAQISQQDLEKLTPAEQQQLLNQLHATSNRIDYSKIDPSSIDAGKYQGTAQSVRDLNSATVRHIQPGAISQPAPPVGNYR